MISKLNSLSNLPRHQDVFISFIGGLFYASGFPFHSGHSFFLGSVVGFFLFNFALLKENTVKKQMLIALTFSLGFYLLGFYWIPYTLKEFGGLQFPVNHLLGLLFSLVIIPQVYIYTAVQRKLKSPAALAILYVVLEQFVPQQFPAHLGHCFLSLAPELPLRLAPVFGVPVYSFLAAFAALTAVDHIRHRKLPAFSYGLIALMVVLNFILPAPYKGPELPPLNVRIVQPNIGNFLKITSERGEFNSLKSVFDSYYELSTKPSAKPLDLIVWPETAFPTLISSDVMKSSNDLRIPGTLSQIIEKTQSELFIGGYDLKPSEGPGDQQSQYNSAFLFGTDQKLKEVYRKIHLIPFGEGLPFGPLNEPLSKVLTNVSYFAEGKTFPMFKTHNDISFISVICYEILFSNFLREFLNNQTTPPQFLVNLTNDSWYGDTAEPLQHLFLAKWRALEFNIPLIRSTNTGITTIIMPDGSESTRLGLNQKTVLDYEMKMFTRQSTVYQTFGLWLTLLLAGVFYGIERFAKRIKA